MDIRHTPQDKQQWFDNLRHLRSGEWHELVELYKWNDDDGETGEDLELMVRLLTIKRLAICSRNEIEGEALTRN